MGLAMCQPVVEASKVWEAGEGAPLTVVGVILYITIRTHTSHPPATSTIRLL